MPPHKASNIVITAAVMSTVISITITLSSFFIANSMAIARRVTETSFGIWKKIVYLRIINGETKAMKSSPLLGPFFGSEFWGFSLLKI